MAQKHIVIDARIRRSSTGRYADRLLEHLQNIDSDNRYSVLLEADDDWKPTASNFTPLACTYKNFSFNPLQQLTFSRYLKSLKADVVHFTMTGFQPLFYFGKQVTTTHDLTMFTFVRPGRLPKWAHWLRMCGYRLLVWHAHKHAAKIIVPTRFVGDDVIRKYPNTKEKVVVTLEATEPPLPVEPEQPKSVQKPFILYVGTAFPHKNLGRLVEAFEQLSPTHPNLQLVLAGKREQHYEMLEKSVQASPAVKKIVFTGYVSDAQLRWLYENTSCYVFASLSEGFGLPALEAMVHGAPVASSNATCLPEVYGDAALYFDPTDSKDIATKISSVLDDNTLADSLRQKGYEQVRKFSWKRMATQTLGIYKNLLQIT